MTAQVLALVLLAGLIHATWNTWLKLAGNRLVAAARETSVVFVALASGMLLKERVSWLAIGAVFVGVALMRAAGA